MPFNLERRIVDSDQIRKQYDSKLFRGLAYGLLGLCIVNFIGLLSQIEGLWWFVAMIFMIDCTAIFFCGLKMYDNYHRNEDIFSGVNPELALGCVAVAIVVIIAVLMHGGR